MVFLAFSMGQWFLLTAAVYYLRFQNLWFTTTPATASTITATSSAPPTTTPPSSPLTSYALHLLPLLHLLFILPSPTHYHTSPYPPLSSSTLTFYTLHPLHLFLLLFILPSPILYHTFPFHKLFANDFSPLIHVLIVSLKPS